MKTIDEIEAIGYEDGYTAAEESGTEEAPVDGWDGWTINGIGFTAFFDLLDLAEEFGAVPESESWQTVPVLYEAAQAYARGAQRGATTAVSTEGAQP